MWFSHTEKGIGPKLFFAVVVFGSVLKPATPATQREERGRETKGTSHNGRDSWRGKKWSIIIIRQKKTVDLFIYSLPPRFIRLSLMLIKIESDKRISYVKKFCCIHAFQILKHIRYCYSLVVLFLWQNRLFRCSRYGTAMDRIYIKTPNPKCRIFLKIDQ